MLSPADREAIANEGIGNSDWPEMAAVLRKALLADRNSFGQVNPAWMERLYLCQVFYWLGQNETEQAAIYLASRIVDKEGKFTVDKLTEAMKHPEAVKSAAKAFVDEEDYPKDQLLAQRLPPETLKAILTNGAMVQELAETISREDYLPGVFRVLGDLYKHAPFTVGQYPSLAVALAVVYDQPLPARWPHGQVPRETIPLDLGNWNALFDYFSAASQSHELLLDVQRLRADQVKFMVDAPLKIDELQWVRKNIRQSRGRFEEVFSLVRYDNERAKASQYSWTETDYRLETISKSGGICVDQAYFAAVSGKARGLPTLFFSGQGSDGGHAWFGFLKTDEKWVMDAGRYANQKYVTGFAYDPQTWKFINDHELDAITNRVTLSPAYRHANSLLVLAAMCDSDGDSATTGSLLEAALRECPENSSAWFARIDYLRSGKETAALKDLLQRMIVQFDRQGDLKTYALQQLIDIANTEGDTSTAASLQQQIIAANRLRRSDLSISAGSDVLNQKLADKDYQGAYSEYKNLIRKFKADGGGNLFYELVMPFVKQLNDAGQTALAKNALEFARDHLKPSQGSILDKAFNKLGEDIGAPASSSRR